MGRGISIKNVSSRAGHSVCRGSVLMEFVIVAPLYFILLGALFMAGDMITNKIRFHIGEHFVTWVGASRFCPRVEEGVDKGEKDPEKVKALVKPMYDLSIGGAVEDAGFRVDTPDEKESQVSQIYHNYFMQFYMGRIKRVPIKMPAWARGMFAMGDAMNGNANMGEFATLSYETPDEIFHSYSFHRCSLTGIDTEFGNNVDTYCRARGIASGQLVNDGILSNVISEEMWVNELGEDNGGAPNPKVRIARTNSEDVQRYLGNFAE